MKKIFAILLTLAVLCSVAVIPVSAEEVMVSSPWVKFMASADVTTSNESGETVYSCDGITQAWLSPGVDLMPELKKLIEGNDKITIEISVDAKIDYNADFDGEEFPLGAMLRAKDVNEKIKDESSFKEVYQKAGVGAFYDTGGGNYAIRAWENETVDGEWATFVGEATLTATDINGGLWSSIYFCFDRMTAFEACKTLHLKNLKLEVTDYEEGDGEILIDLDKVVAPSEVDTSSLDLNANADAADTPELPEGNYLDTKWTKGYAASEPVEGTFNDQPMYSMPGWKSAYGSPFLDILPAVKAAMGDEDEITVYIVFDIRAINYEGMEGETHPFGIKIRPKTTDLTKMKEDFEENYLGTTFTHHGEGDVRVTLLGADKTKITEDWQRIELVQTFTVEEVEDGLWEAWNFCFDNVSTFKTLGAIQVKGMGVFNSDEYEPINVEEPENEGNEGGEQKPATKPSDGTVKEVVLHNPIGGGRYQITFMDAVDTEVEGLVDNNGGSNNTVKIIAIAVGAVVVIGALIAVVALKKKNSVKEEEK